MDYRAATPADEPFLREMLWLAYNWRDQSVPEDHWPDPDGPRRYVEGFGRAGDGGVIAETATPTTSPSSRSASPPRIAARASPPSCWSA